MQIYRYHFFFEHLQFYVQHQNIFESTSSAGIIDLYLFREIENPDDPFAKTRAVLIDTKFKTIPERDRLQDRTDNRIGVAIFQSLKTLHFQAITAYRDNKDKVHSYDALVQFLAGLRDNGAHRERGDAEEARI